MAGGHEPPALTALPATAAAFPQAWAQAFQMRNLAALGQLYAPDAEAMTLSGDWCEGRAAILAAHRAGFGGVLLRARLVTGRLRLRALGPFAAVFSQRFVVTGLLHPDGRDAGHMPAVLAATLLCTDSGWVAVQSHFTADAPAP